MSRTRIPAIGLVILGLSAATLAGTIRTDRSDSSYLNLGSQYANVGRIDESTAKGGYIGSGTLIGSNWIVTAAHMVDAATSLKFTVGGKAYSADRWIANLGWTGNLSAGYDIGLIHLATAVTGIAPAALYTGSYTSELGAVVTTVGYGMTGTGAKGATIFDGKKRGEQNTIDKFIASGRIFEMDFDNPANRRDSSMGTATPLNLEGLIAPGDSGGGVFADFGSGPVLVGVNSFGAAWDGRVNSDYGDISGHTNVSSFASWIKGYLAGSTSLSTMAYSNNPAGMNLSTAGMPEPATMSLLALGALALLRRRK